MPEKKENWFVKWIKSFLDKEKIVALTKEFLKKKLVKKVLGSAVGGLKYILLIHAFNYVWAKWIGPPIKAVIRKAKMVFIKKENTKKVEDNLNADTEEERDSTFANLP